MDLAMNWTHIPIVYKGTVQGSNKFETFSDHSFCHFRQFQALFVHLIKCGHYILCAMPKIPKLKMHTLACIWVCVVL